MTQTTTIDGVSRTSVVKRKSCEWVEHAYLGEVGTGSFRIDDDAGNISVVGHKTIVTEQSATASWPRIFTGFVGRKTFGRSAEDFEYTSGASRSIVVSTKDGNDLLNRLKITDSDGNRRGQTTETVATLLTWLFASDYWPASVTDLSAVTYDTTPIDGNDWRGQYAGDVLSTVAKAIGFNYYIRWSVTNTAWGVVFRNDNTSTDDTSTISISNVMSEVNSTSVFAPFQDAELTEDPEDVYSGVYATGSGGADYFTKAATASTFVARDGSTDDSSIRRSTTLASEAAQFLNESADEERSITLTIRMRAAYVGLIQAGQRVSVKLTHYATQGYDSATYFRVLRRRVTQPLDTDNDYDVALDLSPQETPPAPDICNDLYPPTPSDTYYALGGVNGPGSHPFASDGVVHYWRGGYQFPDTPGMNEIGSWHFGVWGAGGLATTDWAGDCAGNNLVLITVGNGTWTIQTNRWNGVIRRLTVRKGPPDDSEQYVTTIDSGTSVEVVIDDATDGDCVRLVRISDLGGYCGQKWGFTQAVWVAA